MTRAIDDIKARGAQRARPYVRDRRVRPSWPSKSKGKNAYPGARADATRAWAAILADLFPDRRKALAAAAQRSGQLRIIGGVHNPTDFIVGEMLADAFLAQLRANPDYQRRLIEVRCLHPAI